MSTSDEPPLEQVYLKWRLPLLRFLSTRLASRAEAEDLTQETFLRWARRTAGRDTPATQRPAGLLYQIAINLLRDRARRHQRRAGVVIEEADADAARAATVADDACPARAAQARQEMALLDEVLMELAPRQREALLLHRVDGLTQAQIAARLGVSRQMVVRYIASALAHCEMRLQAHRGDDTP